MSNFLVSDEAANIVQKNLARACTILESCDLKPKNNPELALQILSQMYAIESALQQDSSPQISEGRTSGCCQAEGKLKVVGN